MGTISVMTGSGREARFRSTAGEGASGRNWITCFQLRVMASPKMRSRSPASASRSAASTAASSLGMTAICSSSTPCSMSAARNSSGTSSGLRPRRLSSRRQM